MIKFLRRKFACFWEKKKWFPPWVIRPKSPIYLFISSPLFSCTAEYNYIYLQWELEKQYRWAELRYKVRCMPQTHVCNPKYICACMVLLIYTTFPLSPNTCICQGINDKFQEEASYYPVSIGGYFLNCIHRCPIS